MTFIKNLHSLWNMAFASFFQLVKKTPARFPCDFCCEVMIFVYFFSDNVSFLNFIIWERAAPDFCYRVTLVFFLPRLFFSIHHIIFLAFVVGHGCTT